MKQLIGAIPLLVKILFLIYFMSFEESKSTWPQKIILWPWIIFVLHLILDRFFDGLQNTTRNVARIYLLKKGDDDNDKSRVFTIQNALFPNSLGHNVSIFLFHISGISSFIALTYYQGWGTAVLSLLFVFLRVHCIFLPIFYKFHLIRIESEFSKNIENPLNIDGLTKLIIPPTAILKVVQEAIYLNKDPQVWWGELKFKTDE